MEDDPYLGDRIYKCQCCNADIVVIKADGEELSVLLEELDDPAAIKAILAESCGLAGSDRYAPKPLVEVTAVG